MAEETLYYSKAIRRFVGAGLLQDHVGPAQFTDLALQFLDPDFLGFRQSSALTGVALGLLAPDAQTVR